MKFYKNEIYHIYNRGNNRQAIFFKPENYLFFLNRIRKHIQPHCSILAWCLMPNHFHLMIHTDEKTIASKHIAGGERNVLVEGIRNTLSSYTQAINKQNRWTGSLFQQNTKAKPMSAIEESYIKACFHYIHQNPLNAKLVKKMEDWEYSSFADYCGKRKGTLINRDKAAELLLLNSDTFYEESYKLITDANTISFLEN